MLKSLDLKNFTLFREERLVFGKALNVFVGENGTGKTHALKAAYASLSALFALSDPRSGWSDSGWSKPSLQTSLGAKLISVFRPDSLGRLVQRTAGRKKCELAFRFSDPALNFDFEFPRQATLEVKVGKVPSALLKQRPVYIPTRELLTIVHGFVSLYDTTYFPFEETWRDTCLLLNAPLARGPREARIKELLSGLETAMGGRVEADEAGRFYLHTVSGGKVEMHLVAEGLRKLAMIARLIATGALLDNGYLFWDEPEANLNPRVIRTVAQTIFALSRQGIQIFVATHSLFLLRELHLLQKASGQAADVRYFGLNLTSAGVVEVKQGPSIDDIGSLAALDEELEQSDRYLNAEMELDAPEPVGEA